MPSTKRKPLKSNSGSKNKELANEEMTSPKDKKQSQNIHTPPRYNRTRSRQINTEEPPASKAMEDNLLVGNTNAKTTSQKKELRTPETSTEKKKDTPMQPTLKPWKDEINNERSRTRTPKKGKKLVCQKDKSHDQRYRKATKQTETNSLEENMEIEEAEEKAKIDPQNTERNQLKLKMQAICESIQLQTDPANQRKLKQVTLLKKNKNVEEEYAYDIQRMIFPSPRPKNFPKADKIQAVIRWEDTITPINMLPVHLQKEAIEKAKNLWNNPADEVREVALMRREWTLIEMYTKNLIKENDIIEALRRIQEKSNSEEETTIHIRDAIKRLGAGQKIDYNLIIPNEKSTLPDKKEQLARILAYIKAKDLQARAFVHEETRQIRIYTVSLNTFIELRIWLLSQYPETIPMDKTKALLEQTWPTLQEILGERVTDGKARQSPDVPLAINHQQQQSQQIENPERAKNPKMKLNNKQNNKVEEEPIALQSPIQKKEAIQQEKDIEEICELGMKQKTAEYHNKEQNNKYEKMQQSIMDINKIHQHIISIILRNPQLKRITVGPDEWEVLTISDLIITTIEKINGQIQKSQGKNTYKTRKAMQNIISQAQKQIPINAMKNRLEELDSIEYSMKTQHEANTETILEDQSKREEEEHSQTRNQEEENTLNNLQIAKKSAQEQSNPEAGETQKPDEDEEDSDEENVSYEDEESWSKTEGEEEHDSHEEEEEEQDSYEEQEEEQGSYEETPTRNQGQQTRNNLTNQKTKKKVITPEESSNSQQIISTIKSRSPLHNKLAKEKQN